MFRRLLIISTVLAILAPAAASAQSTSSSACLAAPTETALMWKDLYPCCYEEQDCRLLCGAWLKTCQNMANISYRCFFMLIRSLTALDLSECTVIDDPSSKASCNEGVRSNQSSALESLGSDLENASSTCEGCLSSCISFCLD